MILPKHELKEKIEKEELLADFVDLDEQLQPASLDLTVEKIFAYTSKGQIDFDNKERKLSELKELQFDEQGWVDLQQGSYKVVYREKVKVPKDAAGLSIGRTSLARCAAKLQVGFWDPGYEGKGMAMLTIDNPLGLKVKKNAKVAQLIFFKLSQEANDSYNGLFNKENL